MFWNLIRPILFTLPPETAHSLAFSAMKAVQSTSLLLRTLASRCRCEDDRLRSTVFGLEFANPVGLAAGLDKDAHLLPIWHALGFGFAEVGTITPLPQDGNPRPRLFRLASDEALINRMGFNNDGSQVIHQRLLDLLNSGKWPPFPVGINLGKGRETPLEKAASDYTTLLDDFLDLGDYFVVNVSSPNTPDLRKLQEKSRLDELLSALQEKNRARFKDRIRPLLIKVDPDMEWPQLNDIIELAGKHQLAGIIATNTTLARDGLRTSIPPAEARPRGNGESGGLSGHPLRHRSTEFIRHIHRETDGKLPIIGVGGISGAEDAYEKIRAGASLIQVYTGLIYQGPTLVRQINQGLVRLLERDGFRNVSDTVGKS